VRHPSRSVVPGVRFAHPSERTFALLLDLHEVRWEYEPIELSLEWDRRGQPRRGFRPDFWLPELGLFVELTTADQRLVTRKNAKVRRARELYPEFGFLIVYQRELEELFRHHGLGPSSVDAA
jgi:hypothetical protein